jgi:hypothetical protein
MPKSAIAGLGAKYPRATKVNDKGLRPKGAIPIYDR